MSETLEKAVSVYIPEMVEAPPAPMDKPAFNFDAEHNGIKCIESTKPEDKGTENQFWFSASLLCDIFDVPDRTLRNNIQSLIEDGELNDCENWQSYLAPDSNGILRIKTTIYNLEVLNKLGMCCFRGNKKAREIRNKFNDVLVKYETQPQSQFALPKTYPEALRALAAEVEAKEKALQERDEAIKTKTLYQEGLAAEMSGRVGGLTKANLALRAENESLKDAVGRGGLWRTVSMMKAEWIREFGHAPVWQKLKQFSADVKIEPVKDVEEKLTLANGTEKITLSYRYHREAWARYRKYEENLRVSEAEIENC